MKLLYKIGFFVFCFSIVVVTSENQAEAKNMNSSVRLEHYMIDPKVDFEWMSETERASYVAFLYSVNLFLDVEMNRTNEIVMIEEKKRESKLQFYRLLFENIFAVDEAHALFPLVVPVGLAVVRVAGPHIVRTLAQSSPRYLMPAVRQGGTRLSSSRSLTNVSDAKMITPTVQVLKPPVSKAVGGTVMTVSLAATTVGHLPALLAETDSETRITPPVVPPPSSSGAPSAVPVGYRTPGSFCIFGGHASKYVKVGERNICPAPKDTIDNAICAAKKISPSFLCQSFGLTQGKTNVPNLDNLCIPLRSEQGLKDLTVRCAAAFTTFAATVTQLDVAKATEIQGQIKEGIAALEKERGIGDIGLIAYCQDKNKLNRGLQINE